MSEVAAIIGNWYQTSIGQIFEVVAVDEEDDCIEIQYFEGEVAELDAESWDELVLSEVEPPEDWTGAYEVERDDLGYSDAAHRPENWAGPFNALEAED